MKPDETIANIKRETFDVFKDSAHVWIIEERGAEFIVHSWYGETHVHGPGVGPPSDYPTLRKAAARLLQILGCGAVGPQTWPERVCIGSVDQAERTETHEHECHTIFGETCDICGKKNECPTSL